MEKAPTTEITCPRCGYDLRGTVQTWSEACPLTGRCAECGLDFSWRDVLREATHPRLFEHQWRRRPMRSLAWTLWTVLRPWRFWREVRLVNRVRLRPALVVPAMALLLPPLWLFGEGLFWIHRAGVVVASRSLGSSLDRWIPFVFLHDWSGRSHQQIQSAPVRTALEAVGGRLLFLLTDYPAAVLAPLLLPFAFLLIPESLGRARVRPGHIARVAVYSLAFLLLLLLAYCLGSFLWLLLLHLFDTQRHGGWSDEQVWRYAVWDWQYFRWRASNYVYMATIFDAHHVHLLAAQAPLFVWWGFACSRYMKLKHAWWVALLLSTVVYLATVLLHVSLSLV